MVIEDVDGLTPHRIARNGVLLGKGVDRDHGVVLQVGDLDSVLRSDRLDVLVERAIGGGFGVAAFAAKSGILESIAVKVHSIMGAASRTQMPFTLPTISTAGAAGSLAGFEKNYLRFRI